MVLLRKLVRDYWLIAVLMMAGVLLLEWGVILMVNQLGPELQLVQEWIKRPLIQSLLRIALGADPLGDLTSTSFGMFGLAHPLLYALTWGLLLTIGTGALAGEMDRGTADLLLALPVSRSAVYASAAAVMMIVAVVMSFLPLGGLWLGQRIWPLTQPLDFQRLWPITINLVALNLAVAGLTLLTGAHVPRRGRAVGYLLAVLLVSDLLNLLVEFWAAIRPLRFLGFLHYYRPLAILRGGLQPGDIAVLLVLAAVATALGWWRFSRRDIPAA